MKASDRAILVGLLVVGAFAAFYFLALSPKRDRASELDGTITTLQEEISAQEQIVALSRQAQADYQRNYSSLVVLGKAAPADGDTPGLLDQIITISNKANARFELLELGAAPPVEAVPVATPTEGAETETPSAEGETATPVSTTTPAPATEASASSLPIGATVGSAGLGVLPYELRFTGDFFQVADLFKGIDEMIASKAASVDVGGRLITVNGFKMTKPDAVSPLEAEVSIASYVLPESQGLTAGGTSTMPPSSVPEATPVVEPTP